MLEIVITDGEQRLLERSKLFNKNDIISFCLLLCFGKIDDLTNQKKRKIDNLEIDVQKKLKELNKKIKKYENIRIWYSNNNNEDMCNVYFLIKYLSNYNLEIYLCNVGDDGRFSLGCYGAEEIAGLLKRTVHISKEKVNEIKDNCEKLELENGDIRIVESNSITSHKYEYLDHKILDELSKQGTVRYWRFIGHVMGEKIYNFFMDNCYKERVDYLIEKGSIVIDRVEKSKDKLGKNIQIKYIRINNYLEVYMVNYTVKYYDDNALNYFNETSTADMEDCYQKFLKYIPFGSFILDLGCGSGRDSKYFLNKGYKVESIDASNKLCNIASKYINQKVKSMNFEELQDVDKYDGIWACASLLHINKENLLIVIKKITKALKENGYIYISLKNGAGEEVDSFGRYYSYYTKKKFEKIISLYSKLEIINYWKSNSVINKNEKRYWNNFIIKKK